MKKASINISKVFISLSLGLLLGCIVNCSSLNCEITDGTQTTKVSYLRLFTTSDDIKGELPGGYKLESVNQKIDTKTIEAIIRLAGIVQ